MTYIKSLAHKMRGTGAGFGFPFLTAVGEQIEHAAKGRSVAELKGKIDELSSYLSGLEVE